MKQLPTDTMGQRIKAARKRANLTQKKLGKLIKKREDYISKLERDEFNVTIPVLREIAIAVNTSIDYLVLGYNNTDSANKEKIAAVLSTLPDDKINELAESIEKIIKLLSN